MGNFFHHKLHIFIFFFVIAITPIMLLGNKSEYKLQKGDKIQINFQDIDNQSNLVQKSDHFTIRNDGTIQHPLIGTIQLAGYSVPKAEQIFHEQMKHFFTTPRVSLELIEKKSIQILVFGAIDQSGIIDVSPGSAVAEVLLSKINTTQEADLTNIQIIRKNGTKQLFSLPDYLYKNDTTANIILKDEDKIIVPAYSDRNFTNIVSENYILKSGNVINVAIFDGSKNYSSEKNRDVLTIDNEGYIYHNLVGKVHIGGLTITSAKETIEKKAQDYLDAPIAQLDIVSVNARMVYIFGEINNPGYHPLRGRIRLSEFLAKAAGGLKESADIKRIIVTRKDGTEIKFNFEKFLYKRADSNNVLLEDGDRVIVPSDNVGLSYKLANTFRRYYWILQFIATTVSLYIVVNNM